jgi:hypothetical protein
MYFRYPLARRWPQSLSGRGGVEINYSQPLPNVEPSIIQPVAQLCRLTFIQYFSTKIWDAKFGWCSWELPQLLINNTSLRRHSEFI